MTMKELGELLQEERNRQGRSLDEIMTLTKVSRICLEAIEEGDMSMLPEHVYTKGFIKAYITTLNLPPEELLKTVDAAYGISENDSKILKENHFSGQPEENFKIRSSDLNRSSGRKKWFSKLIILIILVIAAFFAWRYAQEQNWISANNLNGFKASPENNASETKDPANASANASTNASKPANLIVPPAPVERKAPAPEENQTPSEAAQENAASAANATEANASINATPEDNGTAGRNAQRSRSRSRSRNTAPQPQAATTEPAPGNTDYSRGPNSTATQSAPGSYAGTNGTRNSGRRTPERLQPYSTYGPGRVNATSPARDNRPSWQNRSADYPPASNRN